MWTILGTLIIVSVIYAVLKNSNGEGGVSRTSEPLHRKLLTCERCGGPLQDIGGYHHGGLTICKICASEQEQTEGEFTYGEHGF